MAYVSGRTTTRTAGGGYRTSYKRGHYTTPSRTSGGGGTSGGGTQVNLSAYSKIGGASEGFKQKLIKQGFDIVNVGGSTYVSKASVQRVGDVGLKEAIKGGTTARGAVVGLVGESKATQLYKEVAAEQFQEAPRRTSPIGTQVLIGGRWRSEEIVKPEGIEIEQTSTPAVPKTTSQLMTMGISFPSSFKENVVTGAKKGMDYFKAAHIIGKVTTEKAATFGNLIFEKISTSKPYAFIEKALWSNKFTSINTGEQFITTRERTETLKEEQKKIEHKAKEEAYGIALSSKVWGDVLAYGTKTQVQKGYEEELSKVIGEGKTSEEQIRLFETFEEPIREKWEARAPAMYDVSTKTNPFYLTAKAKQEKQISTFEERYSAQQEKAFETFSPSGLKGMGEFQEIPLGAVGLITLPFTIGNVLYHPVASIKAVAERPFQSTYRMVGASLAIGGAIKGTSLVKGKIASYRTKTSLQAGETIQYAGKVGGEQVSINLQDIKIVSKSGKNIYTTTGRKGGIQYIYGKKGMAYSEFMGKTTTGGKTIAVTKTAEIYPDININLGTGSYFGTGAGKSYIFVPKGKGATQVIPDFYSSAIAGVKTGGGGLLWKTGTVIVGKESGFGTGLTQQTASIILKSTGATKSFWTNIGKGFTKTSKFNYPFEMIKQGRFTGSFTPEVPSPPLSISTIPTTTTSTALTIPTTSTSTILIAPTTTTSIPSTTTSISSLVKLQPSIIGLDVAKSFTKTASLYARPVIAASLFMKPLETESYITKSFEQTSQGFGITPAQKPIPVQKMATGLSQISTQGIGLRTPTIQIIPEIEIPEIPSISPPQITLPPTIPPVFPALFFDLPIPKIFERKKKPSKTAKMPFKYRASLGGVLSGEYSLKMPKGIKTGLMPIRWMMKQPKKRVRRRVKVKPKIKLRKSKKKKKKKRR